MLGLANASVSVLRGTDTDDFGDETDASTAVATGVPAAVVESSKVVLDQATQTPRTVRSLTCVMPSWADVLDTDRLQDQATGRIYIIESVERQPSLGYPGDQVLTLKRDTGDGP